MQEISEFRSIFSYCHKPRSPWNDINLRCLAHHQFPQKVSRSQPVTLFAVELALKPESGSSNSHAAISSGTPTRQVCSSSIHLQGELRCVRIRVDRATGPRHCDLFTLICRFEIEVAVERVWTTPCCCTVSDTTGKPENKNGQSRYRSVCRMVSTPSFGIRARVGDEGFH